MHYAPMHCRTSFSLLNGCLSPEEVCAAAAADGYGAAAVADINNFYGLIRFARAASASGIKPIAGVRIVPGTAGGLTTYCMNRRGFARANEIITRLLEDEARIGGFPGYAETLRSKEGRSGAVACSGGVRIGGVTEQGSGRRIDSDRYDPVADLAEDGWEGLWIVSDDPAVLTRLSARGREGLFAGLFYGLPFGRFAAWARRAGLPCMALNDAVFRTPEDRRLHRILRAIDLNTVVEELAPGEILQDRHGYAGADAMERYFSAVPDALGNALRLQEEAGSFLLPESYVFPSFNGMPEAEAFRLLRTLCLQGADRRYGGMRPEITARLRYELQVIREKGFAGYFLVVHDIVSRRPRTCGRGSSASSIVSYLLGITHVDPLAYNLFFERFLNMGRKDPPDIDVDFPWDEREEVLKYVFRTWSGSSGIVADHVTFGPRSCIREPAEAFGIETGEIGTLVRAYRNERYEEIPGYLLRAAARLRGMPRHIGTHPGGVVVTPGPITGFTHLQPSSQGYPLLAWEKDAAEDAGLVKIDLLGNRSLGVLRDTIRLVNRRRPMEERIEWESFDPLADRKARRLIETGDTLGVFYVESPATRQLLRKMGRGDYEHLVVASSIIRPAANAYINEYVRRLHGAPYDPVHPSVADTLAETRGIMVYQEDVSRVAIAACGFTPEEADSLRKVLTKKDRETRLNAFRRKFFDKGRGRGLDEGSLTTLWEGVLSFDGYSFCKAHSASYALVSYKLAWLKCRYPLEFLTSVINNGGGFYSRQVYVNAVRRMGFPVLQADVNASSMAYVPRGGALRVGLGQLRDVPQAYSERILAERAAGGPYADLFDFVYRVRPSMSAMRVLIKSGALDSVAGNYTRPQLFWLFYHLERRFPPADPRRRLRQTGRDAVRDGNYLLDGELFGLPVAPDFVGDYSESTKILDEAETMDLIVSRHPIEIFTPRIERLVGRGGLPPCISSRGMPAWVGRRVCLPGTMVCEKEVRTRKRRAMCFVSFEDAHAVFETVVFPDVYERVGEMLATGYAFVIVGTVEDELGALQVRLEDLVLLNRPARRAGGLTPAVPTVAVSTFGTA